MRATMRATLASVARVLGAVALVASAAAAQHSPAHQPPAGGTKVAKEPAEHGGHHAASSGWKELDAFHTLMMQTWHPASGANDLAPARAKAGAMADAARAWAAAAVPAGCDTAEVRATVARLATESRALADLAARPETTDAALKAALKALHDRFEVVEHGCHATPARPGGHHP